MAEGIPARLSAAEGRRFGLQVGAAFLVLAALLLWREREMGAAILGGIGGLLILAGLALPARLGGVYAGWMGLAHLLSKVTTPVFMGVVYFLVITPIGLLRRALGHQPLRRPTVNGSYFVARSASDRRSDLQRQF
jgi:hypothetical protein